MKRNSQFSFNVAYCGIMCALALIVMFMTIIPSTTYIMPAFSGIIIWTVSGQINRKWGFLTYVSTALLSFLVFDKEAAIYFILIFGYYPMIRDLIHKVSFPPVRFLIKLAVFNVAAVTAFTIVMKVLLYSPERVLDGFEGFGEYAVYVLWGAGNLVFFFYDIALKYIYFAFFSWIKPKLNKKIK